MRPPRCDRPGALHHVTNRGHGHRTLFATEGDARHFLSLIARTVRRGALEVHAYALLSTHFHLLVGSEEGTIAAGLQWLQDMYARYYNRTRDRDGHVFKGRYFARRIDDPIDLAMVLVYIDRNPVDAGMANESGEYAHGSARHYLTDDAPPWLRRDVLRQLAARSNPSKQNDRERYLDLWRAFGPKSSLDLAGRACSEGRVEVAPLAVLLASGPRFVQEWLIERTVREERGCAGMLVLSAAHVMKLTAGGDGRVASGASADMLRLRAGLLHLVSGLRAARVGAVLGLSRWAAQRHIYAYREALRNDHELARRSVEVVERGLREAYGALAHLATRWTAPTWV